MARLTKVELEQINTRLASENTELRTQLSQMSNDIATLKAAAQARQQAASPAPSTTHVVWRNEQQRRFWTEKACYRLSQEQPGARSFPAHIVKARAEALFVAAGSRASA